MFPDIVDAARTQINAREAILDGEALAYSEDEGIFYPFQITVKRKRKHSVDEMKKEYPLRLFLFDILYLNGKNLLDRPFSERKKILRSIIRKGRIIAVTEDTPTSDPKVIEGKFDEYVRFGLEGIVAKDPKAKYAAGARKFSWIKLKRSYRGELADTIDVAVVGYLEGKGRRTKLGIGALLGAVYNKKEDRFETIAKIGSGLSEEQTRRLKKMLDSTKVSSKPEKVKSRIEADVWVTPKYVVEVNADEITKSPVHTCCMKDGIGLSLRFPRLAGFVREDKGPQDATTTAEVMEMFKMQTKDKKKR